MSRIFGDVFQAGYVVRDIQAAMNHWVEVLGVGPWFYSEGATIRDYKYKGQPTTAKISLALANSGPLQIELIQPLNDGPSMYRDFLAAGNEGLQHIAYFSDNFDADVQRYVEMGYELGHEGTGDRGKFAYLLTEAHPGTVVEIVDRNENRERIFKAIADASRNWDGSDPIRTFASLTQS